MRRVSSIELQLLNGRLKLIEFDVVATSPYSGKLHHAHHKKKIVGNREENRSKKHFFELSTALSTTLVYKKCVKVNFLATLI